MARAVQVHRHPAARGYAETGAWTAENAVASEAVPGFTVALADLLPPR